jgi:hypothetical protein
VLKLLYVASYVSIVLLLPPAVAAAAATGQLLTLCERDGLFKVLLMWLQFHLVERQGLVGGR